MQEALRHTAIYFRLYETLQQTGDCWKNQDVVYKILNYHVHFYKTIDIDL